ncbi:MAG TPA: ABC transporter ATP-binding protein [Bacteroidetes bacterium]|nr:ABC transporter ATP-binding protein [Bacteroidota bacterium]
MIQSDSLLFSYPRGPEFNFPAFALEKGESLLVLGASGSGKSTWLQLLSGLREPQQGEVKIGNNALFSMSQNLRDRFRARHIGFVFQDHSFIPSLNAWENIQLPFSQGLAFPKERAQELSEQLGLAALLKKRPQQLSQGERQRLSVLRAVLPQPDLILADEPSSSLDDTNCEKLIHLLKTQCSLAGSSLIVVTHDQRIKDQFERRIER